MDVAGNGLDDGTHTRTRGGIGRQQRGLGPRFFQIFQNRDRLVQNDITIDQRGNQPGRVQRQVVGPGLLSTVAKQMNRDDVSVLALQVQGNTHAPGRRAAKVTVQFHWRSGVASLRDSSRGSGKETFSGVPSSLRTDTAPSSFRRAMTCLTRTSGADAPAVTPTRRLPASHPGWIMSGSSIR